MFFTYIHFKPDATPFYVGKGNKNRISSVHRDNRQHKFIVAKYGAANIQQAVYECSTEHIAIELEVGLIKCFSRMGIKLANATKGGDGISGYRFSTEQRKNLVKIQTAIQGRPEVRYAKHVAAIKQRDPVKREAMRIAVKKAHEKDPLIVERISKATKLAINTPEKLALWREVQLEAQNRPEVKLKQKLARLGKRWITNGVDEKTVPKTVSEVHLPDGYWYGRLKQAKNN